MGKGDQRSRRGKLYRGTFGKSRPRKAKKKPVPAKSPFAIGRGPTAAPAKKAPRKATPASS